MRSLRSGVVLALSVAATHLACSSFGSSGDPRDAGATELADAAQPAPVTPPAPSPDAGDAGLDADTVTSRLRVFVTTSTSFGGALGSGGGALVNADKRCESAASVLSPKGRFVAWLSTSAVAAAERIPSQGVWYDTTQHNVVFAYNPATVTTLPRAVPDVNGELIPSALVWTGTAAGGQRAAHCLDWTNGLGRAIYGKADALDGGRWTNESEGICGVIEAHLYCFELPP